MLVETQTKEMCETVRYFAARGIRLCIDERLAPTLTATRGNASTRVAVCSFPKSGTYFVAALLEALGFASCRVHIADVCFVDGRFRPITQIRTQPLDATYWVPAARVFPLVQPGQFFVSHLPCHDENIQGLRRFRVLFIYRNLRDVLVSYMRYVTKNWLPTSGSAEWVDLPDGPAKMEMYLAHHFNPLAMCHDMVGWKDQPGVLACGYEEFMGDHGPDIQRERLDALVRFTGVRPPRDPARVLQEVIGRETLTWSGARTDARQYWSDTVEQVFRDAGGVELNRLLGYPEP